MAGLLTLPACWVESINGLDEGELLGPADRDRAFEPVLVGTWVMHQEDCAVTINITVLKDEYTWRETGEGKGCSDEGAKKEIYYRSAVYKLDAHLFLDLTARSEDVCDVCRAMHWIFLMQLGKDSFTLTPIDSDWLKNAVDKKIVILPTLPGNTDTITASPTELKAFCRKYADDKEVFKPLPDFTFKRQ